MYADSTLETLRGFLRHHGKLAHNGDFLDRWHPGMETQVLVSPDGGVPDPAKRNTWSNEDEEWHHLRIPHKADSKPYYTDRPLTFNLAARAESIGSTGWDWTALRSRWLGYDFDTITGHAKGVGVSDAELDKIKAAACAIPWVEVRRSTGGNGLHLYVIFDEEGVPTQNHTEHAALGRSVLGLMSQAAGFDFKASVDVCGGMMWFYAKRASNEIGSYAFIRGHERTLSLSDLPANWRDHIEVANRKRAKVRVRGVAERHEDIFDALASAQRAVPLDATHRAVIDALAAVGATAIWDFDRHLLQSHTKAFADVLTTERERLGLTGYFTTVSEGTDLGSPNCFAFPLVAGGWQVCRFGPGAKEDATWHTSEGGWTTCRFNVPLTLAVAAKARSGGENPDGSGYYFDSFTKAAEAAAMLGQPIEVDPKFHPRETTLRWDAKDRLVVEIRKEANETQEGWLPKGRKLVRVFDVKTGMAEPDELADFDGIVRAVVSPAWEDAGYFTRVGDEQQWVRYGESAIAKVLRSYGYSPKRIETVMGLAIRRAWSAVNRPFESEYPGGRQWNMKAAQFKVEPAPPGEGGRHPHWDDVLRHLGQDLDGPLRDDEWAKRCGIRSGGDYLLRWIACLLREPFGRLPYLHFFGPQKGGKSTLHEAIKECLISDCAVVAADRALTNQADFNGELANAILCYVEEADITKAKSAYAKIKDWVVGRSISIHKKRKEVYSQPNTTHWIQCSNDRHACPIPPGDTRIMALYVPTIENEIDKDMLIEYLKEEASRFLRTVLDLELPEKIGRLRLPVIETTSKRMTEEDNRNPVVAFLEDHTFAADGYDVPFSDFFESFIESLPASERHKWTRQSVAKALPDDLVKGRMGKPRNIHIGNRSFEQPTLKRAKLVREGDRLVQLATELAA